MAIWELGDLTWEEVAAIGARRPVAVLPVGAVEAHGPHLPLRTDGIIAGAMAREGARRLAERGRNVLLLPPLLYTAAPFAAGFAGTVSVAPETVTRTVVEIAGALGSVPIAALAVANAHLDPAHLAALHDAAAKAERVVFPDLTRKPWALRLGDEFRTGACHAGRYESSVVLAETPDLVREDLRSSLPPVEHSLATAIREGRTTFEEAGGSRAYFGWPADASAAEGADLARALGGILEEAVTRAIDGGNDERT